MSSPSSVDEARALLVGATPQNESFTQRSNFSAEKIDRALRLGFRRPQWIWCARDGSGAVLGVVSGWGSAEVERPFVLDFVDVPLDTPDVAQAILDRAVAYCADPGRATVEIIHFIPTSSSLDDPALSAFVDVLSDAGFRMLVRRHRYRLDVRANEVAIPETRLRFDQVERADDPRLPEIMAEILVGSLDAHDRDALNRGDLATVATETVTEYLSMDPFDSMFVALDPDDTAVGLVIGGLRGSADNGTASFIGVSHQHRGNGYAAQLLGWITKRMIGDGALYITGETDDGNFPMAAAFTKIGYPENESRIDFVREIPNPVSSEPG